MSFDTIIVYPKYSDAVANSVDPDQMLQNVTSDWDLHFSPLCQLIFRYSIM